MRSRKDLRHPTARLSWSFAELIPASRDPMVRELPAFDFSCLGPGGRLLARSISFCTPDSSPKTYPRRHGYKILWLFGSIFCATSPVLCRWHLENVYEDDCSPSQSSSTGSTKPWVRDADRLPRYRARLCQLNQGPGRMDRRLGDRIRLRSFAQ